MNVRQMLRELYAQREQLERVIARLESLIPIYHRRRELKFVNPQEARPIPRRRRRARPPNDRTAVVSAARDAGSERASERLLQAAADAALDIILIADDERRFVDLNRAAADVLEFPREELIGRRIEDFFIEAQGKPVHSAWDAFVVEGEQYGVCGLRSGSRRRTFEYRAKAHFRPGLHLSILREIYDASFPTLGSSSTKSPSSLA